jgi:RHS repeat-associated protein
MSILAHEHTSIRTLGNARISVKPNANNQPVILQYDSYYPFGLEMGGMSFVSSSENKYKYNGKEKQTAHNLGWYDYGARFYDPQVGRWWVVDALADEPEQIDKSVYAYAWNNPTNLTDPDGNCPWCVGALVGALTDAVIQTAEIAMDDKKSFSKDFSLGSVGASAVAGATGVGLAAKISKLGPLYKVAIELTHDAAANAANQYIKEGTVSPGKAVLGAGAGKVVGDLAKAKVVSKAAQTSTAKVLAKQSDRAVNVAVKNSRPSRIVAANAAEKKAKTYVEKRGVAAATATSNVVSSATTQEEKKKKK